MASAGFEQNILQMARNPDLLAINQCLNNAGIEMGGVISNWLNSPVTLASGRVEHVFTQAFSPQRLAPLLENIRTTKDSPTALNLNAQFEQAWQLMVHAANQDPVAKCGLPLVQAQKAAMQQTVAALYPKITAAANQQIENQFKPALVVAMSKLLQARIQQLKNSATAAASKAPGKTTIGSPAGKTSRQVTTSTSRISQAPVARNQVRRAPRTRAAGTFLKEGVAATKEGLAAPTRYVKNKAQELVLEYTPETVEMVALGEFARQILVEEGLDEGTQTLQSLNDALAGGNTGSADFSNLEALVSDLEATNERLYAHIGLAMISYYGHEAIDTGGDFIIDVTLGSVSSVERVSSEAVSVVCSPGGPVSQVSCSALKSVVGWVYLNFFVPTAGYIIKEFVHEHWDQAMACGRQHIENPSLDGLNCGVFAAVVGWLPETMADAAAFAMPYLNETQQSTLAYHKAVLALAQTAQSSSASR